MSECVCVCLCVCVCARARHITIVLIYINIYTQPGQCMQGDWTLDLSQDSSLPLHDTSLPLGLHSAAATASRGGCGAKFAFSQCQTFGTSDRNTGGEGTRRRSGSRCKKACPVRPRVCTREMRRQREHTQLQERARARLRLLMPGLSSCAA